MYDYKMERIFSFSTAISQDLEVIGPTPEGFRLNQYTGIEGGEVSGPRLQGKVLPVGGDWVTVRPDGVVMMDVRITIESHDGALIYGHYKGVGDSGPDGYQRLLEGDVPRLLKLRAVPRFSTSHPDYLWLNRLQCINIGEANQDAGVVGYDVYALS